MKLPFLGFCLFIALFGENVSSQKHKIENNKHFLISKLYDRHYSVQNIINHNKIKRQIEGGNNTFIKQLSDIAMKSMEISSDYGHKLIGVEEIGNISRSSDQNKIEVTACRFNNLNQKKEIEMHPEKKLSINDFFVCDVCQITMNKTENITYKVVEMACVLHDSRAFIQAPEVSLVGGYSEIEADSEKINQLALFSLDSITQQTMAKRSLGLIRVVSAKSQVVAGMNYKIKLLVCEKDSTKGEKVVMDHKNCRSCDISIWEQTWLNKKNVTDVACSEPSELSSFSSVAVTERASPPGSYSEIEADSDNINQLALFSLDSITQQTMSKRSLGLIRVVSAKSQVVAGMNYKIKLLVCEKDSTKGEKVVMDYKNCRSCDITIWEQAWLNNKNVTKVACSEPSELSSFSSVAVTKRDIHDNVNLGAKISLNSNDKKIQDIVAYALLSIDKQEGSNKPQLLSKIINVSKQIVSGIIYNIELEICDNSTSEVDEKKCRICNIKVWEQEWENKKNTTKLNCYNPHKTNTDISNSEKLTTKKNNDDRLQLKTDFENFISTHNKVYTSLEEKNRRFRIFAANMKKVKLLQNHEQGSAIYGATQFADLTKNEFKKKYLGLDSSLTSKKTLPMAVIPQSASIPNEFDWRDFNAVTPVKNQGACGSCWAFSAIANIEGQYALKSKELLSLSEQELIDCDNLDNGCGGGLMTQAFEAVENLGGLETESDYPYEGHVDRKGCQLKKSDVKVSISKAVNVSTNEEDIAKFLVKHGPLSVGVNANAMQFYMGGVSHPIHALCSPKSLDHGVAIVGYGVHRTKYTHKNLPYWLIKNSWGPGWGEKGYYLLYRGDGSCGVNQMVSSAIIE